MAKDTNHPNGPGPNMLEIAQKMDAVIDGERKMWSDRIQENNELRGQNKKAHIHGSETDIKAADAARQRVIQQANIANARYDEEQNAVKKYTATRSPRDLNLAVEAQAAAVNAMNPIIRDLGEEKRDLNAAHTDSTKPSVHNGGRHRQSGHKRKHRRKIQHAPAVVATAADWQKKFEDIGAGKVAGMRVDNNGAITMAPIPDDVVMKGHHLVDRHTGKRWDAAATARTGDIKDVAAIAPTTTAVPYTQLPGYKSGHTLAHEGRGSLKAGHAVELPSTAVPTATPSPAPASDAPVTHAVGRREALNITVVPKLGGPSFGMKA